MTMTHLVVRSLLTARAQPSIKNTASINTNFKANLLTFIYKHTYVHTYFFSLKTKPIWWPINCICNDFIIIPKNWSVWIGFWFVVVFVQVPIARVSLRFWLIWLQSKRKRKKPWITKSFICSRQPASHNDNHNDNDNDVHDKSAHLPVCCVACWKNSIYLVADAVSGIHYCQTVKLFFCFFFCFSFLSLSWVFGVFANCIRIVMMEQGSIWTEIWEISKIRYAH